MHYQHCGRGLIHKNLFFVVGGDIDTMNEYDLVLYEGKSKENQKFNFSPKLLSQYVAHVLPMKDAY